MKTVVISRSSGPDAKRRDFEDALIRALGEAARLPVLVVPSVYDTAEGGAGLAAVREVKGDIAFASWLHPRAACWLLRARGVEGDSLECGCGACCTSLSCFATGTRCICSHNLASFASPEECADVLLDGARRRPGAAPRIREVEGAVTPRWYPVIDYSLCSLCGQCHDFCLFGVYTLDEDDRPAATSPDRCKPGCAACARICPEGAIMFPLYAADEGIAGAPGKRPAAVPLDAEAFFKRGEPCPLCGCACDCERSTDGTAPPGKKVCPACGCLCDDAGPCACKPHLIARGARKTAQAPGEPAPPRDELDDLIDELDKLDV